MQTSTKQTIQKKFERYHELHPDVYQLFLQYARELKVAGCTQYSSDAILHRIRWHKAISGGDDSGFKINNNFSSRYARKAIANFPSEFVGFFKVRMLLVD